MWGSELCGPENDMGNKLNLTEILHSGYVDLFIILYELIVSRSVGVDKCHEKGVYTRCTFVVWR